MPRRREVIQGATVLAALAAPIAASAAPAARPAISAVLFDPHIVESRAFARAMQAKGVAAFSTEDDVGRLWGAALGDILRSGGKVAGLTAHTDFFIAGVFAREAQRAVAFEGQHDGRGEGVAHALAGAHGVDDGFASAENWAGTLGAALATGARNPTPACGPLIARSDTNGHPGLLVSWVVS